MDLQDIEVLKMIVSREKMRYDDLDVRLSKRPNGTNCYVLIDFSSILIDIQSFKEGLVDTKDFNLHAGIELMNVFAHYKHYFKTRDAERVILIGFVKDSFVYSKNKDILDSLVVMSDYFPNVYMIPDIVKNGLTVHVVSSVMDYIHSTNKNNKFSSIYVISKSSIDRQLMCVFPSYQAYFIHKGFEYIPDCVMSKETYLKKLSRKDEYYENFSHKAEFEYMNVLIGKYFNSLVFKNSKETSKIVYEHSKIKDKLNILNEFIESSYEPSKEDTISSQFVLYLQSIGEIKYPGIENLMDYERYYDYRYQNMGELHRTIIPIFNNWKQKIKDYEVSRKSENYKALIEHDISYNWLLS
jgi:hypothetical protein